MLRSAGRWQGNRTPDNQPANKLVDAGGSWFEDVGSTPTASNLFDETLRCFHWNRRHEDIVSAVFIKSIHRMMTDDFIL